MFGSIIFFVALGLMIIILIALYNRLVRLRNAVKNSWSQIDVQLKRRHDLIPNLVEAVKGAMDFEQNTLREVVAARNAAMKATGPAEVGPAESVLTQSLGRFMAVVEQYPTLKANQNIMALQEELTSTENRIAFARQFYNDTVLGLNNAIELFPSNIVAKLFKFRHEVFLEIEEAAKAVPKVDFRR